jgi:ABC-type phosphate transport system substrate-binding protein
MLNKLPPAITNAIASKSVAFLLWIGLIATPGLVQARQLIVVTDTVSTTTDIKTTELAAIFHARTRAWPDGRKITMVMRDPGSADAQLILRRVLDLTPDEARALIKSHPGVVVVAGSDEEILRIVSSTRGAIGFIDLYSLTKDVRVVKIDGKLPMEPGYLLKGN